MTKLPPRVIVLDGNQVITGNGRTHPAPAREDGPQQLLSRLLGSLGDNGQVLISGAPGWDHLADADLSGDWTVTGTPGWMTARRGNSRLRIGKIPNIDVKNNPLLKGDPDLIGIAIRHQMFATMTGVPFYADGGTTSLLLMDETVKVRGRDVLRKWADPKAPRCREDGWPAVPAWAADHQPHGRGLVVDRNAQYLAGVSGTYVPLDAPEPTGPIGWDRTRAGLWQIITPDNPEPRLPHPCGTSAEPGAPRWVAHPTAELLEPHGAPRKVLDSWTLPRERCRRAMDTWYERLRDARAELVGQVDDPDAMALLEAVKDTYARGISHLDKLPARRWHRHDWRAIFYSSARTRMWRALRATGQLGAWPAKISTDTVVYPDASAGKYLKIGTGIGQWKVQA